MATAIILDGHKRGQRIDVDREELTRELLAMRDGPVTLSITRLRAKHSPEQRGYYFGVVVQYAMEATGFETRVTTHEVLKAQCLDPEVARTGENGRIVNGLIIGGSISQLDTLEMHEYIERCRAWLFEKLNCPTPDPDPDYRRVIDEAAEKSGRTSPTSKVYRRRPRGDWDEVA